MRRNHRQSTKESSSSEPGATDPVTEPPTLAYCSGAADRITAEGPTVEFPAATFAKLRAYVSSCAVEIGGMGLVRVADGGLRLVVEDVFIVEQSVSAASTELSEEGISELLLALVEHGHDPAHLNLWWHSHARLSAFFSTTDVRTLQTSFPYADWVLGIVTNHRGELVTRLHVQRPLPLQLTNVPVALELAAALDADLLERIRAEIVQKMQPTNRAIAFGTAHTY